LALKLKGNSKKKRKPKTNMGGGVRKDVTHKEKYGIKLWKET